MKSPRANRLSKFFLIVVPAMTTSCAPVSIQLPQAKGDRPVMVGGQNSGKDCISSAFVLPTGADNDDHHSVVYAAPSRLAEKVDWIKRGYVVSICEDALDGKWKGIVYVSPQFFGPDQKEKPVGGCALDTKHLTRRQYNGPCYSGWLESRNLWLPAD